VVVPLVAGVEVEPEEEGEAAGAAVGAEAGCSRAIAGVSDRAFGAVVAGEEDVGVAASSLTAKVDNELTKESSAEATVGFGAEEGGSDIVETGREEKEGKGGGTGIRCRFGAEWSVARAELG